MADPITILIVDDHAVVRHGLRSFLELQSDFQIIGEAADIRGATELAARLRPRMILTDLVLPDADGAAGIRQLREAAPDARILVLTSYVDDARLFAALQAGAAGYQLKDVQPDALAEAIRQVDRGQAALHPKVAARLVTHATEPHGLADFTVRERDVLKLLAEGFANKEIAQRLSISEKTVKTHVSNIFQKLGVQDRTQAALAAVRRGLVE